MIAPTYNDAGSSPDQPSDATACAFEFSACLIADPLDSGECDFLGSSGTSSPAADGGLQPSAACALQLADCVMRMPAQSPACMDMLATCTL